MKTSQQQFFESEQDIQKWIELVLQKPEGFMDIIENKEMLDEQKPQNFYQHKIKKSFTRSLECLSLLEIVSNNTNISLDQNDVLKPDFVLYNPEWQTFVMVELKNRKAATREAGTELGAYAAELKSLLPLLSDGDIVHVIISPEWPTLLKHYIYNEIIWGNKFYICMTPVMNTDGQGRLEVVNLEEFFKLSSELILCPEHLGGYFICLYDNDLYTKKYNRDVVLSNTELFKSTLQKMSSRGNQLSSHGFAFLWRDGWKETLSPFFITVVNAAPLQTSERFLKLEYNRISMTNNLIKLWKSYEPQGHGNTLSQIAAVSKEMSSHICDPHYELLASWSVLQKEVAKTNNVYVSFVAWGLFEERVFEILNEEYINGNINIPSDDPSIGFRAVNDLLSEDYEFIFPSWTMSDNHE